MRIANDRISQRVPIRLVRSSTFGHEITYLEQGAYVKVVDPYYLPRHFDIPFSSLTEVVVYTQYGMGVIPRGAITKERW